MPDVILRPRDNSWGTYDVQAYSSRRQTNDVRLYARDGSRGTYDVQLRPVQKLETPTAAPGGFPTQYSGWKVRSTGSTIELCLVATADAPTGMGGQLRFQRTAGTFAAYLVETSDPNASPVRVRTGAGVKAIRRKT